MWNTVLKAAFTVIVNLVANFVRIKLAERQALKNAKSKIKEIKSDGKSIEDKSITAKRLRDFLNS